MINDRKLQQSVLNVLIGKVEETVKHPNQQKLDVHEPEKDELTAKDFEMLRAGKKAKMKKEDVDQVNFTVIQHNAFNIALNESYANYLDAAKFFCENEEEAVTVANEFYNEKDPSIIIEMLATEGFIATYEDFIAEGHEVSEPKYKVENNNVYAEYVVKDKETGDFTRYVHHGTFSLDAQ